MERLARVEAQRDALAAALAAAREAAGSRADDEQLRNSFFAMASHELRTPLQSISLLVALMLTRLRGAADEVPAAWLAERLVRTQDAVHRMRRLVERLLNVSELASGHIELQRTPVDLGELAEGVVASARAQLEWASCPCRLEIVEPARGSWDRLRLEIVLDNLLTNAAKYARGAPIVVRVGTERGRACLAVADRGPGIPRDAQERIFERFERGADAGPVPGFGLGLWIVRTIVLAHGGEVRVESAPGEGATFTVLLPAG